MTPIVHSPFTVDCRRNRRLQWSRIHRTSPRRFGFGVIGSINYAAPLTEATLDESVVTLTLSGRVYEDSNFSVRRAVTVSGISGVTVGTFDIDRVVTGHR